MGNKDKTKLKIPSYNSKSTLDILSIMIIGVALSVMLRSLGDTRTPEEKFRYLEDRLKSMPDKKERA